MFTPSIALRDLSDDVLLVRLAEVLGRSRRIEAELIAHLAEVDARRLYLREACPSMHAYATERLHLSDAEAYLRITVARLSRRFPVVLAMLADGRLHLSGAARLAPHLDDRSGERVLARAAHLSKRAIDELIAEIAPQPDAPSLLRRLPGRTSSPAQAIRAPKDETSTVLRPDGAGVLPKPSPSVQVKQDRPAMPVPIAPARYKVQFTAGAELHDKLTRAQALLRREVPDGDLAVLVDRAVTLLLCDLERRAFARAGVPRKELAQTDPTPSSRHIPDPIRRSVWNRDGGQCTFRDKLGRRCSARDRLEFHHVVPFARGGDHSVGNVRLLCAQHNAYQADLDFGSSFMAERRQRDANRVAAAAGTARPSGDRCRELRPLAYNSATTIASRRRTTAWPRGSSAYSIASSPSRQSAASSLMAAAAVAFSWASWPWGRSGVAGPGAARRPSGSGCPPPCRCAQRSWVPWSLFRGGPVLDQR
jgi:hypothetical protein